VVRVIERPAPLTLLGAGLRAEVLAAGDSALKLYRAGDDRRHAFAEAAKLAIAASAGAPVPEVRGVRLHEGRWGVVMARCEGPTLADRMRAPGANLPRLAAGLATLHARLHRLPGTGLPGQRARLRAAIAAAPGLTARDRAALGRRLEAPGAEPDRLCHGDFHPGNVMGAPDAPVVIDWVDATAGDPAADACRTWLLLDRADAGLARLYLDAYVAASGLDRAAILGWTAPLAAARLAEGIASETGDLLRLARAPHPTTN
jgi:aminoglycoside phosphotransferase (APT) family kinase protein